MKFNKGEWSELYAILYLSVNPNLKIVDENLKILDSNIFKILEMIFDDKKLEINTNELIKIKMSKKEIFNILEIEKYKNILFEKIQNHKKASGSFEVSDLRELINQLFDSKIPKGKSKQKSDLNTITLDQKRNKSFKLGFNIKSKLGSPATLLNASNHTNFIFELENIDENLMNQNNKIKTRTKLLDRFKFLEENRVKINFLKVESKTFENNLKLVDSKLDEILAEMLILSYKYNEKNISNLLNLLIKNNKFQENEVFYKKKLRDFANAVTFGMRPSEAWNGKNEVNGGILLVEKDSEVYLLDLIYFKEHVDKYLTENIKLDSPSFSRYKMFEIYKEENRFYLKLNLQIRFK